jgi:hypothetical protein
MHHVPRTVLRRLADDPLAVPDRDQRHLASCGRCQAGSAKVSADATLASQLLTAPRDIGEAGDVDLEWIMLQERLRRPGPPARPVIAHRRRLGRPLARVSLGAGVAAAAGVIAVGAGAAVALTTVYAPVRVAPVRVSSSDLQAITDLASLGPAGLAGGPQPSGSLPLRFGQLSWTTAGSEQQVSSVAQARALTQLAWTAPASLPAGVGSQASIMVQPQVTATLQFSRSAGQAVGGSTLQITAGPAIAVQYGGGSGLSGVPTLVIAEMKRPQISSTGATASQLEAFLLSQPGMPAGLAQQLRALGNPGTVLPVPVPSGMSQQQVTIGGAPAVLVTDHSGVVSAVVWESRDGVVHGVGGLLDSRDILSVARQVG